MGGGGGNGQMGRTASPLCPICKYPQLLEAPPHHQTSMFTEKHTQTARHTFNRLNYQSRGPVSWAEMVEEKKEVKRRRRKKRDEKRF